MVVPAACFEKIPKHDALPTLFWSDKLATSPSCESKLIVPTVQFETTQQ